MNRQPLSDELPYRFHAPGLNPLCLGAGRLLAPRLLRDHRVEAIDLAGDAEHLRPLLGRGDGVLITPNHTDHADSHLMFDLSRRVGRPFYYMAAYQIFRGFRRWFLPRVGAFPVDREGADLTAFKTGVDLIARGRNPLVVFPEGEIYHLGDRLTPIREGALALAAAAAKRLAGASKTVRVVPVAIKYRFLDGHDPVPALQALMGELERRATWWPRDDLPIVERVYHYAQGMLALKEFEYLGEPRKGTLPERLAGLREFILGGVEARRLPGNRRKAGPSTVPERVKEVRRACLDALAGAGVTPAQAAEIRKDLHDVFVAAQTWAYPGDYLREGPTLERVAETLSKFEEDFLGVFEVRAKGPRRAVVRVGEPIDVGARLAAGGRPRAAVAALTVELEERIQALLDAIGPGRPVDGPGPPASGAVPERRGEPGPGGGLPVAEAG